ncbi:hypothetical protein COV88_01650 [Candidatus Saccharibacteria bacterium CG11_big_fil_rev_8_21_14_0_20_41_19]|nr:hypothetical protein [Candidatus Saccharibacteria bacterium]OIP85713.1 MAG: hypothetical protein AUK57_02565 [Candidatus Saccharibacteria bacterium CG2_30_41_52]PIQ70828.1 MAG: hypothetical protein COV88_01650 [Candidatus Saccharibacteria bacterium CG11_big_fil_rev_8_21_14_0_20_41_19]PIZ60733.1 MAG: hypothetical protein COY18_00960 [Candidatus Saccharibacteria bacterium CG_4_10_14_0_2_um_filter_41_11]PJC29331.1 MAG: hypothetical protein CO052_03985 [Candidatus Saccharibacteria bacterium CG_4
MSEIRRTNQGGSIVTFIIIGAILAVALVGAVYMLKQHGDQVRKDEAIATADRLRADEDVAKSKDADNSGANESSGNAVNDGLGSNVTSTSSLPATGSKLSMSELVGMFLMTTAFAGYVSSSRSLSRSL